jgi:hypothetical protein
MSRSTLSTRLALWLAVCALLLKAAVPLLASVSAQAQGKALVEVCTTYGVATVALDDGTPGPAPQPEAAHAGDHCVLGAVVALASPPVAAMSLPAQAPRGSLPRAETPEAPPADAAAAWVARLKHGPPSRV